MRSGLSGGAKQRCTNPSDLQWRFYGGRGIEFQFETPLEAGLWILEHVENVRPDLELARIDTNGHYEKGNLRFVSRAVNMANRRNTVLSHFEQRYWPYSRVVVTRKLSQGKSRQEIINDAHKAVAEKCKAWTLIQARLEFITSSMPETIIVTPYRETSCTTVATAAPSAH
ncbi:hypothetical protein [Arcanobacterium haemolyticum]